MPLIKYVDKRFGVEALDIIKKCNAIIAEYLRQGFQLTLRQVYYQLVARDLFPEDRKWLWTGTRWMRDENGTKNAEPNYKWLGGIVNDGRLAGLIDWAAIEDRTRNLQSLPHWDDPRDIVEVCADQFRMNMWDTQKYRPEVWIEKDALVGVIEGVCNELDIPYFSCRGYTSQSEMWGAGQRLLKYGKKIPVIFHFGDHDPSGKDMTRDIVERLEMFTHGRVKLERLALNMNQIEQYNPPPNPTKLTDSRAQGYITEFGNESWELDALEPAVIAALIRDAVRPLIQQTTWDAREREIKEHRKILKKIAFNWETVKEALVNVDGDDGDEEIDS